MKLIVAIISILLLLVSILPITAAFTTIKGNDINFIWGFKDATKDNYTDRWVPKVDYPNSTSIKGHFEYIYINTYDVKIPYVKGIIFNSIIFYREYYMYKQNQVSIFTVPIGDRNMKEFGTCRPYEIRKGVCTIR